MDRISAPSVSADGRQIVFTGARRKSDLWVIRSFMPRLQVSR